MKRKKVVLFTGILTLMITSSSICINYNAQTYENKIINHQCEDHDSSLSLIAHRGLSSKHADNSKEALIDCINNNCIAGVEIDVRLTKDKQIVLLHDSQISGLPVSSYSYDEIEMLRQKKCSNPLTWLTYDKDETCLMAKRNISRLGDSYHLLTLDEALECLPKDKILLVDLKFDGTNDDYLIDEVGKKLSSCDNVIIQSFSSTCLTSMCQKYPNYKYQILISKEKKLSLLDEDFDGYGVRYNLVTYDMVKKAIDQGKTFSIWTIDGYNEIDELFSILGDYRSKVNYISNAPDSICYQYCLRKGDL